MQQACETCGSTEKTHRQRSLIPCPPTDNIQLSCDDCLDDKTEDYETVLCCSVYHNDDAAAAAADDDDDDDVL